MTLGYPYQFQVTASFDDDVKIEKYVQTTEEWVDWNVTDYGIEPADVIEFGSGWTGQRFAATEIHTQVQFRSGIDVVSYAEHEISVFADAEDEL
ncbi:hypothetical protein [Salimicrobium flavidum]|uniref:Uncharacterized protein n=1 Tax=Salimicrobium flavidum TaxID=570947 RepID=A0A1N7KCY3_9BACI|nr:hypothetical protein [Salimicrobium flavidum]SIS59431.1 hypothetical protein SAMN05421687_11056 [Salimicrobium flavidum]